MSLLVCLIASGLGLEWRLMSTAYNSLSLFSHFSFLTRRGSLSPRDENVYQNYEYFMCHRLDDYWQTSWPLALEMTETIINVQCQVINYGGKSTRLGVFARRVFFSLPRLVLLSGQLVVFRTRG